jgi:hypothetical protein
MLNDLRQLKYPKEFRIAPIEWSPDLTAQLDDMIGKLTQPVDVNPPESKSKSDSLDESLKFIANLGTDIWRVREKMLKPGTDEPLDEMRKAYRHLSSTWEKLRDAGFKIQNHTGEKMPKGGIYQLKVLAYQPEPGLNCEVIIETVKPSIYYKDRMIQMGEVIVGTPET